MTPEQQAIVIQKTITGATCRDIETVTGIDHSTIARARQKPDIKAKVEAGIAKLINRGLNPAINTLTRAAAMGTTKGISTTPDLYKISIDASKTILNHVSGSGPQTVINQLILQQSAPDTVREVSGLQSFIDAQWSQATIEPSIQNLNHHSEIETVVQDTEKTSIEASHTPPADCLKTDTCVESIQVEGKPDPDVKHTTKRGRKKGKQP